MARIRIFTVLVLAVTTGGTLAFATYNYVQKAQARTITIERESNRRSGH